MKKYFTVRELTKSSTAEKLRIKNDPRESEVENMKTITIPYLSVIREFLKTPLVVNSGFRTCILNEKIGGVQTSKHLEGLAVDIVPKGVSIRDAWERLKKSDLSIIIDQAILYPKKGFIHIGFCKNSIPRQQFFIK